MVFLFEYRHHNAPVILQFIRTSLLSGSVRRRRRPAVTRARAVGQVICGGGPGAKIPQTMMVKIETYLEVQDGCVAGVPIDRQFPRRKGVAQDAQVLSQVVVVVQTVIQTFDPFSVYIIAGTICVRVCTSLVEDISSQLLSEVSVIANMVLRRSMNLFFFFF